MAGSRPPVATSAHPNAGWLSARTVLTSWFLAGSVILVVQQTHRDLHELHELSPLFHWLRDSALAVPLAALSILVAGSVVRRFRDARLEGASSSLPWRLLYAVLSAVGFAALSIPGNELHAWLFAAEHHETLGWLGHALRDANAVLDVALLVMLPLALVPVMGKVPPHQAAGRRDLPRDRGAEGRAGLLHRLRRQVAVALPIPVRPPSFCNLQVLPQLVRGHLVADVVALIGTIDIVLGEVDR